MKTLTLNAWGTAHQISFRLSNYAENNNLYVGLICYDDGYPEPWSDLTVNLSVKCAENCAFIDTNNNGKSILEWLVLNELATPTGRTCQSGFCIYPEMKFDMDELMKYTTKGQII